MRLSDLQTKDVISVTDGKRIGNIIDVSIEESSGKMLKLIIEPSKLFSKFFPVKDEMEIVWEQIVKIGEDVILVSTKIQG